MGQKTHPIGFRLGITKGWQSSWFNGKHFAKPLLEDYRIRQYIEKRLANAAISKIYIERTFKTLEVTIHTARPGMVIGTGGREVEQLKKEIAKLTESEQVEIYVEDVRRPELDATLVAKNIARQIEARISFRRAMKNAVAAAMRMGAEGIKVRCSGRLGGVDMARSEEYKEGRIPLSTLRADIDYACVPAFTIYGVIGVKVWIFKGMIYGKVDVAGAYSGRRGERQEQGKRRGRRRKGRRSKKQ